MRAPTPNDVAETAAMRDLAARNIEVTRGYYLFSQRFRGFLGDEATWPTFAAWASAQAGRTIRKEDLLRALERRLGDSEPVRRLVEGPLRLASRFILRSVLDLNPFERSSQAVSRGNIKVYSEIGAVFAKLIQLLDAHGSQSDVEALCASLTPGPPPEGQDLLRRAIPALTQAIHTPQGKQRSELILLSNAYIGLHEQTRLQPEIEASIDGSVWDAVEVKQRLADALLPHATPLRRAGRAVLRERLMPALGPLISEVQRLVREIVTERMMVLELPGEVLRLGQDLSGGFPPALSAPENEELKSVLQRTDPTPDSLQGSGAVNWADFRERIHFIVDLFRSRQFEARLFEWPAGLGAPPA
jgi:hypothetical protein